MSTAKSTAKPSLLIVDDYPDILKLIKLAFDHMGFEVFCAGDIATAIRIFNENRVDVAIIDHHLQSDNGIELGRKIRAMNQGSRIPLILFSGAPSDQLEAHAREAGFDAFLVKPASIDKLYRTVDSLLQIGRNQ